MRPLPRRPRAETRPGPGRHTPVERRRPDGRAAAFSVLEAVELKGGSSNALLSEIETQDERERHLATTLVYGVLRQRLVLDRLIERSSRRPLDEIDAAVLIAARLGLYQVLFLTRVPRAAAVNEAVALVRAHRGRGAAPFANAVLRSACRSLDEGRNTASLLPDESLDPVAFLAVGREGCEELLVTCNRPAALVLRVARGAGDGETVARALRQEGIETLPSPVLPGALRVARGAPQRTRLFREGMIYIQDEAAQIVPRLLFPFDPEAGLLDLCAAPGGKLLAAVEMLRPGARIVAADISVTRLHLLDDNARRMRATGILRVVSDMKRPAIGARFARVLLDAPCSGTGVIRRHPEIRWRRSEADIALSARMQEQALLAAADLLASGGRLVYSVCSLEPEEGPRRVTALVERRTDLRLLDARTLLPPGLHSLVDDQGCLVTLPHRDDVDGFFAAVLEMR
ncbi:MAG: hypothetical protein DMF51_14160 [Acidobacteria bacterium]|nr:MAG: hypothetical protein DMF51_14160 [Acidobacteriota bacterium]